MELLLTMMPLKEPNPLNILGNRRLEFIPEFFETVYIDQRYNLQDSIIKWIDLHLKGRYFVGTKLVVDDSNQMVGKIAIGFENQKELSYFVLACPLLKYN